MIEETAGDSAPEDPGGDRGPVTVHDEQDDVAVDTALLRRVAVRTLRALRVPSHAALDVSLASPTHMAELKERALGVHAATDVLSFPMDLPGDSSPGPLTLGDIVICPAVAQRQARALGRTFDDELAQLLVHGILHVLGRDHADPSSERAMAHEERALLAQVVHAAEAVR